MVNPFKLSSISTVVTLSLLCGWNVAAAQEAADETPVIPKTTQPGDIIISSSPSSQDLKDHPSSITDPDFATNVNPHTRADCFQLNASTEHCQVNVLSSYQLSTKLPELNGWDNQSEIAFSSPSVVLPTLSSYQSGVTDLLLGSRDREGLKISYSALDLGDGLVGDLNVAHQKIIAESTPAPTDTPPKAAPPPPRSHALNLWSLRSLRKPVGRKVLDSGVAISGPAPRDTSERFFTRDYMFGNWGGWRDMLYDKYGVEFSLASHIDLFGNVSGGRSQNSAYTSVHTISFDWYTDPVAWKGGQVHWTNAWIDGGRASIGRTYTGSFNSVAFADPPRKGLRLFELWYGQKLFKDQLDIRLGKIYPFVKFGISQVATVFQNSNFGYPGFIGSNTLYGYSTLYGAAPFGTEILITPKDSPWFYQLMFMDGFDDPTAGPFPGDRNQNTRGLDIAALSSQEGLEGILEIGYKLNQHKGDTGLPGTFRAGFQFHTGEFRSIRTDLNGGTRRSPFGATRAVRSGNYGFYAIAEQMLFRESRDPKDRTQGLSGFIKGTFIPLGDRNTIAYNAAAGLVYEGPFPGRSRDLFGIGVAHTELSDGLKDVARNSLGFDPTVQKVPSGETALEVMYALSISPWWLVIFSAQHIINPSFNAFQNTPNATVLGVSTRFGL